jgi:hypothetical protein
MIPPAAIHFVPGDIVSDAALREFMGFDDHVALYPQLELFVLWFRLHPGESFAVLMGLPRSRPDLGEDYWQKEWPLLVDPHTRVVRINRAH